MRISFVILLLMCAPSRWVHANPAASAVRVDSSFAPADMKRVEGGRYVPLYKGAFGPEGQEVESFYLAARPVTNAEFLAFVRTNPQWQRSAVKSIFAGSRYLAHWSGDLALGPQADPDDPVVHVSWFAARAYAEWTGMRLPTTAEWELAASAGSSTPQGRTEAGFHQDLLRQYTQHSSSGIRSVGTDASNYWGVHALHGNIWEWVEDFNSNLVTGESRNNTDLDRGLFCGSGSVGASDLKDYSAFLRFALRSGLEADYTGARVGFRLAADGPTTSI